MFIDGLGIAGYRSFGPEIQYMGPFSKINIFAGKNNSGKSNVLLFLHDKYNGMLERISGRQGANIGDNDIHLGMSRGEIKIALGVIYSGPEHPPWLLRYDRIRENTQVLELLDRIYHDPILTDGGKLSWFKYSFEGGANFDKEIIEKLRDDPSIPNGAWNFLCDFFTGVRGGIVEDRIMDVLAAMSPTASTHISIELIPAIRKVGEPNSVPEDFSGDGLIERLAKLQNPGAADRGELIKFEAINKFLKMVTGNTEARIEIPYERNTILAHMDGKTLPLSHLGTGIHEVVILAAAATILENQIICMEEPELHLHPGLQKKLIGYLADQTNNQYFISSHSVHFLDSQHSSVFHVILKDGRSHVKRVASDGDRSYIGFDLGFKASDIVQANCIVWVEGPSDRIYINKWLRQIDQNLQEGLHYSIMFYGGRLLSHLSADDPDVEEFISLRRLNRNMAVIIDSDRDSVGKRINKTKKRVIEEIGKGPGIAWVTSGREIENYIEKDVMLEALAELDDEAKFLAVKDKYDKAYSYRKKKRGAVCNKVDKVKLARIVTRKTLSLDVLDLKKQMDALHSFILVANE